MLHIKINATQDDVATQPAKVMGAVLQAMAELLPSFAIVVVAAEMPHEAEAPIPDAGVRIIYAANCKPVVATLIMSNLINGLIANEAPMEEVDASMEATVDTDVKLH